MRFWHETLAADLAPFRVVPRGFGGSTLYDVWVHLDRLVLPLRPAAILLYEGDNDIDYGVAPQSILSVFKALAARVQETFPECHIFVISIKPSLARWQQWPDAVRANALLAEACRQVDQLHYLDVAAPMLNEAGRPREALFLPDGLHMNEAGYRLWREVVRPALLTHVPDLAAISPTELHPQPFHDSR